MAEKEEICDMLFCDSKHNVQQLSKYIYVCEGCWFMIMNGVHKWNDLEKAYIQKLEKERSENGKKR